MLYLAGAIIALLLNFLGISPLVFALGMYLPLELNTPLLVGGFVAWLVRRSSKDTALVDARSQKGTLIASGFIAGGALFGVLGALLKVAGLDLMNECWAETDAARILSIVLYAGLVFFLAYMALKTKVDTNNKK